MFANAPMSKFGLVTSAPADGTKPANAFGTAVTPGTNTYGAYAQLVAGASVTDDIYELTVGVDTVGISAAARDCIVTIGVDPTGGTSYTDTINHVLASSAGAFANAAPGGGVAYRFYLVIKAGSSIAAKASVNSATLTAINVWIRWRSRPQHAHRMPAGQFVDTYGATTASSSGTALTLGTVSEGAWTQIGTLTRPAWYLEFGYGVNDGVQNVNTMLFDIGVGDASNKLVVIANAIVISSSTEMIMKPVAGEFGDFVTGDILYARAQAGPNAASAAASVAIYAVGG